VDNVRDEQVHVSPSPRRSRWTLRLRYQPLNQSAIASRSSCVRWSWDERRLNLRCGTIASRLEQHGSFAPVSPLHFGCCVVGAAAAHLVVLHLRRRVCIIGRSSLRLLRGMSHDFSARYGSRWTCSRYVTASSGAWTSSSLGDLPQDLGVPCRHGLPPFFFFAGETLKFILTRYELRAHSRGIRYTHGPKSQS